MVICTEGSKLKLKQYFYSTESVLGYRGAWRRTDYGVCGAWSCLL